MEEMEIWLPVQGFEGLYEVSNLGRLKCLERYTWNKANGSYSLLKERILKQDTHNKRYPQIGLWKDGIHYKRLVHRLVATVYKENPDNLPEVDHLDNDPMNNRADNLRWCTHWENMQHRKETTGFKQGRGAANPSAKLNMEAVRHIRKKEMMGKEYAKLYGVSISLISQVQTRTDFWLESENAA